MSTNPVKPGKGQFNGKNSGGTHRNTPVSGQMKAGTAHCLGERAGRFGSRMGGGGGTDVRRGATFSGGTSRLSNADKAGGQHGAGHSKQPGGHGKQGKFADTSHKGHTK